VRIRIVPSAQQQIRDAIAWWDANRPAAPGAIVEELRRALRLLRVQPEIGARSAYDGSQSRGSRQRGRNRINDSGHFSGDPTGYFASRDPRLPVRWKNM